MDVHFLICERLDGVLVIVSNLRGVLHYESFCILQMVSRSFPFLGSKALPAVALYLIEGDAKSFFFQVSSSFLFPFPIFSPLFSCILVDRTDLLLGGST